MTYKGSAMLRRFAICFLLCFSPFLVASDQTPIHVVQSDSQSVSPISETSQENRQETDDFVDSFEDEFRENTTEQRFDPLMGYNRAMTDVNDFLYTRLLFPIARGYGYVVPEPGRKAVSNFFNNLKFPIRFVNNLLQFKFNNAAEETGRFLLNSTLGIAGLMDPASEHFNMEQHSEDFGQTLGFYGIGGGFHIVLPIYGPSNLRDTIAIFPDSYIDPVNYWENRGYNLLANSTESFAAKTFNLVNDRSIDYVRYEAIKKDAVDMYLLFREAYEINRDKNIKE